MRREPVIVLLVNVAAVTLPFFWGFPQIEGQHYDSVMELVSGGLICFAYGGAISQLSIAYGRRRMRKLRAKRDALLVLWWKQHDPDHEGADPSDSHP